MTSFEAIRDSLKVAVNELNPLGRCPFDIQAAMRELGIALEFGTLNGRNGKAYLVISDPPHIVVQRDRNRIRPVLSERFSIAHELGHWVVWRRFGILPSSKEEYWKHEVLCNEFAGQLLVPVRTLEAYLQKPQIKSSVSPVYLPNAVAKWARVSWDVAARSITALLSNQIVYLRISAIRMEETVEGSGQALMVSCSSLSTKSGSFLGNGAHIADDRVSDWLTSLPISQVISKPLTIELGQLRLSEVPIILVRDRVDSWIMQFCTCHTGFERRN